MKKRSLDMPASPPSLQQAVDDAVSGQVVLLNRDGRALAAIVPFEIAAAGMAAIAAADDAVDVHSARQMVAELNAGMETIRLADLRREMGT